MTYTLVRWSIADTCRATELDLDDIGAKEVVIISIIKEEKLGL